MEQLCLYRVYSKGEMIYEPKGEIVYELTEEEVLWKFIMEGRKMRKAGCKKRLRYMIC